MEAPGDQVRIDGGEACKGDPLSMSCIDNKSNFESSTLQPNLNSYLIPLYLRGYRCTSFPSHSYCLSSWTPLS
ncbi:hypothetical protein SeLEV6574_g06985 [Synchytrium endobioticum]|uniref:Uncharacterized protein n=1 Tax=Synchytrium endobioticum TaxID=286115 RepID=A0A507CE53_9FUNG|nr:hypothetical protein SeLEV6574_g06985 [Synchytrium endobioticum]